MGRVIKVTSFYLATRESEGITSSFAMRTNLFSSHSLTHEEGNPKDLSKFHSYLTPEPPDLNQEGRTKQTHQV